MFAGVEPLIVTFARAAWIKCETLHTDPEIFDVWSTFVAEGEKLTEFQPRLSQRPSLDERLRAAQGLALIADGVTLLTSVTRARVPMPKSGREYLERIDRYRAAWAARPPDGADTRPLAGRIVGESRSVEIATLDLAESAVP
jgi:hypothetical protein